VNAKNTCKTKPWRQGETFRLHHKRTCRLLAPNVEAHPIRSTALQCAIHEGFQVCTRVNTIQCTPHWCRCRCAQQSCCASCSIRRMSRRRSRASICWSRVHLIVNKSKIRSVMSTGRSTIIGAGVGIAEVQFGPSEFNHGFAMLAEAETWDISSEAAFRHTMTGDAHSCTCTSSTSVLEALAIAAVSQTYTRKRTPGNRQASANLSHPSWHRSWLKQVMTLKQTQNCT